MSELSDVELYQIVRDKNKYKPDALQAAHDEINSRDYTEEQKAEIYHRAHNIEQFVLPRDFKSPSNIINYIALYVLIKSFWDFRIFQYLYYAIENDAYEDIFIISMYTLLGCFIAFFLYKRKKIGWLLTNFMSISYVFSSLVYLYYSWFYADYNYLFPGNSILKMIFDLAVPLFIVFYINKEFILEYFNISLKAGRVALIISLLIIVWWNFKNIYSPYY